MVSQDLGDERQHAGLVGDFQVQVEAETISVMIGSSTISSGGLAGGIIALTTSPSTAVAVCGPPAPGPDMVISVIAADSTVTALNGPLTDASGWPG